MYLSMHACINVLTMNRILTFTFYLLLLSTAQWSYWDGLRKFESENHDYLQGQIGNPKGEDKPNKKFYDPRVWVRKAEEAMVARVMVSCEKLKSKDTYEPSTEPGASQCTPVKATPNPVLFMAAGAFVGSAATILLKTLTK
jgi:hypothetical protein